MRLCGTRQGGVRVLYVSISHDFCSPAKILRHGVGKHRMSPNGISPGLLRPIGSTTRYPAFSSIRTTRSEEHTSELQSLMRISYAVFCLKKKNKKNHSSRLISKQTYTQYKQQTK